MQKVYREYKYKVHQNLQGATAVLSTPNTTELIFPHTWFDTNVQISFISRFPWDGYAQACFQINQIIATSF